MSQGACWPAQPAAALHMYLWILSACVCFLYHLGAPALDLACMYTNAPDIREQSKRKQADSLILNLTSRVILLSVYSKNY